MGAGRFLGYRADSKLCRIRAAGGARCAGEQCRHQQNRSLCRNRSGRLPAYPASECIRPFPAVPVGAAGHGPQALGPDSERLVDLGKDQQGAPGILFRQQVRPGWNDRSAGRRVLRPWCAGQLRGARFHRYRPDAAGARGQRHTGFDSCDTGATPWPDRRNCAGRSLAFERGEHLPDRPEHRRGWRLQSCLNDW